MNGIIVLTNEDHSLHPLNVETTHPEPPVIRDEGDGVGGMVLPLAAAQDAKLTCVFCGSRLMLGEDYEILEEEEEPWRA